jgi:hypothetical protein
MQWADIPFRPPERTLRQFAGLWLVFFAAVGCWQGLVQDNPVLGIVCGVLAVVVGSAGLLKPPLVRPLFVGWMILAFPLGWTISRIVLAAAFYGVFTPVGLVFKALGRDPLARRSQPGKESYWAPKPMPADARSYLRQF